MPEMLQTIIADLLSQESDIVVVSRSDDGNDALQHARDARADVLITQDRANGVTSCLDAILWHEPLGIVALSADGQSAAAVSLVRQPISLNGGERSALAAEIRTMAVGLRAGSEVAQRT